MPELPREEVWRMQEARMDRPAEWVRPNMPTLSLSEEELAAIRAQSANQEGYGHPPTHAEWEIITRLGKGDSRRLITPLLAHIDSLQTRLDALTAAARPALGWSDYLPEEPGWYWHLPADPEWPVEPVEIVLAKMENSGPKLIVMQYDDLVFNVGGKWGPRLTPPTEGEGSHE